MCSMRREYFIRWASMGDYKTCQRKVWISSDNQEIWERITRNARRSFVNYLLYVAAMTVLLAIIEISNCIAIIGELAGFQVISLPLLIAVIQIVLVGYIDLFLLKQRAKEFASYLLLGMEKRRLTRLFLCGFLYGRSMFYTFLFWGLIETVCSFRLRGA